MNTRQLKKRDKKAMEILIAVYGYNRNHFTPSDLEKGRIDCWHNCSLEWGEYESNNVYNQWLETRYWDHPNAERWMGMDPDTGELLNQDKRPRKLGHREHREFFKLSLPTGYRWRGKKVVKTSCKSTAATAKKT